MVAAAAARTPRSKETLIVDLAYPGDEAMAPFSRADLTITGVDHSSTSYEVRLFLNNPRATSDTSRTPENGYAGRFNVLGHGGCYGDDGHCEVPEPSADPMDLRPEHPLTPLDTYVTITERLRAVIAGGDSLKTVTLVPVSITPRRADRKPAPELLKFNDISLQTYLTATEDDVEPLPGQATAQS